MISINNLSNRFAKYLSTIVPNTKYPTVEDQIEVYDYAIKGVFEELSTMILLIFFSLILGIFTFVVFITLTFIILRSMAGGIHLKTHKKCQIMSLIIFIGSGLIVKHTLQYWSETTIFFLLNFCVLMGIYIIYRYAPRDNPNKSIVDKFERNKFRRWSFLYLLIWNIIMIIFFLLDLKIIIVASCFGLLLELFNVSQIGYTLTNLNYHNRKN